MPEPIVTGLVSAAIYDTSKKAGSTIHDHLTDTTYETTLQETQQTFDDALQEQLTAALAGETDIDADFLAENWDEVVTPALADLELGTRTRDAAIATLTDAIVEAVPQTNSDSDNVRGQINLAVAEAYEAALRKFFDKIDDEQEQAFQRELDINLAQRTDEILQTTEQIQRQIRMQRDADIRNSGFISLDTVSQYQRETEAIEPVKAWRFQLGFDEIAAGYAVDREWPNEDDDRVPVTEGIILSLQEGNDTVLLGLPGSGKSTVCRQVAHKWATQALGPVLYRKSSESVAVQPGTIKTAIHGADDPVLVVVEDVVSGQVENLHNVVTEISSDEAIFLFDSRISDWKNAEETQTVDSQRFQQIKNRVEPARMPRFDEEECHRMIEKFREITDDDTTLYRSEDQLSEETKESGIGAPLYLTDQLTSQAIGDLTPDEDSTFRSETRDIVNDLTPKDEDEVLPAQVGLLLNALNAANLPVDRALIYSLIDSENERYTIDGTIDRLRGDVLIEYEGDDKTLYQMRHEEWSRIYLSEAADRDGTARLFTQAVDSVFELLLSSDRQEEFTNQLPNLSSPLLDSTDEGSRNESIGPFIQQFAQFWDSSCIQLYIDGSIFLPESVPATAAFTWNNNVARACISSGEYNEARSRLTICRDLAEEMDSNTRKATSLGNLGLVARSQGDYEEAEKYHKESLKIERKIENNDRSGEAASLNNLGLVARSQGDYEEAEEYYKESREIQRELGDKNGEAKSLNNLGSVARSQGEYNEAEEYYYEASRIFLDIGAVRKALKALDNLSEVALERNETEVVRDACKQALNLIDETDIADVEQQARDFRILAARVDDSPESTKSLYRYSLAHVLEGDGERAKTLSQEVWNRREDFEDDNDIRPLIFNAGVCLAVHLTLSDADKPEINKESLLSEIEPHVESLSESIRVLFESLSGNEPPTTPDELRERAEQDSDAQEDRSVSTEIHEIEARAAARLLEPLEMDLSDLSTEELHRMALRRMMGEDPDAETIVGLFDTAYERREDHTPESDDHIAAVAAGVGLACHIYLSDTDIEDESLPAVDDILAEIDPHISSTSSAVQAVYEEFIGGNPDVTPDELRDSVDPSSDDLTLEYLETIVFAVLLVALRSE